MTLLQDSAILPSTQKQSQGSHVEKSFVLYLATDTPSMVTLFQKKFATINVPVYDLPQQGRREEGKGVLFGESDKVQNKGINIQKNITDSDAYEYDDFSPCLKGWSDTITDMLLLSHADIVIATKPSSFVQTLPMSIAFGRNIDDRKLPNVYCEVIPQFEQILLIGRDGIDANGTKTEWVETTPKLQCYKSYTDWCCHHSTWIKFHHVGREGHSKVISREFVRFPPIEKNKTLPHVQWSKAESSRLSSTKKRTSWWWMER